MKRDKRFLISIISIILFLILGAFIRGQKEMSITENRNLNKFPIFSLESFKDSSFQNNIEDALTDQILLSEELKSYYNKLKNNNTKLVTSALKPFDSTSDLNISVDNSEDDSRDPLEPFYFEIGLTPSGGKLAKIDSSDHLVFPKVTLEMADESYTNKSNNFNRLVENYPNLDFSCFYIETDKDIDFVNGSIEHDLIQDFYARLDDSIKTSALYIKDPKTYQDYFYKTDHHWDSPAQLIGYQEIIKLVKGEDEELLDIEEIHIEGLKYNGYRSREIGNYDIYDDFSILWANGLDYEIEVNKKPDNYGDKLSYINGDYSDELGKNHYGIANGGDPALIEYRFNQPEENNILIFVDSFSNPINTFIASHFNNTYIVDLRYYEDSFGKEFSFSDFLEEHDIDEVLFTGYNFFYANDSFLIND